MLKIAATILLVCFVWVGVLPAQSVLIVSRPTSLPVDDDNGELSGESNRFNEFSGFYPVDHFELVDDTTLDCFTAFGSVALPDNFSNSAVSGWTVQIFNDDGGTPDGYAFADVFTGGNFGSEGIVYLPAVEEGNGMEYLQNSNGAVTVKIDFATLQNTKRLMSFSGIMQHN